MISFNNQPCISSWIKSLCSELVITFHVLASQYHIMCCTIDCDVIISFTQLIVSLWKLKQTKWVTAPVCVIFFMVAIYLYVQLLRNSGKSTKITLLWGHKQFATSVHILSSIYSWLNKGIITWSSSMIWISAIRSAWYQSVELYFSTLFQWTM